MEPVKITAADAEQRMRALCRQGATQASLPRRQQDRWILLHSLAQRFGWDEVVDEPEATGRIGAWLMSAAPFLRMDRVALRRAMVDEGFLERDAAGREYRRSRKHERRVVLEEGMPELEAVVAAVREREEEKRIGRPRG